MAEAPPIAHSVNVVSLELTATGSITKNHAYDSIDPRDNK